MFISKQTLKDRLTDLKKLIELRNNFIDKELFIPFWYIIYSTCMNCYYYSKRQTNKKMYWINQKFNPPFKWKKIKPLIDNHIKVLPYKNQTIIDDLNITVDEQRHFKTIITDEQLLKDRKNKKQRIYLKKVRSLKLSKRDLKSIQKYRDIITLKKEGKTQKDIACLLDCAESSISRYMKRKDKYEQFIKILNNPWI